MTLWQALRTSQCTGPGLALLALTGDRRRLDAYVDKLTGRQGLENLEESRYQRAERFDPVRRGSENDHGNRESGEVLLVLQILIGRQHRVEVAGCQLQQLTVSLAGPAHRGDGADIVL